MRGKSARCVSSLRPRLALCSCGVLGRNEHVSFQGNGRRNYKKVSLKIPADDNHIHIETDIVRHTHSHCHLVFLLPLFHSSVPNSHNVFHSALLLSLFSSPPPRSLILHLASLAVSPPPPALPAVHLVEI